MDKTLADLNPGETATILSLHGGRGMHGRLRRLGLIEGQVVQKLSTLALGGPVVVLIHRAQIAIGRGMARRILVRTNTDADRRQARSR